MKNPIYLLTIPKPDPLGATHALDIWAGCGAGCAYCDSARHLRCDYTAEATATLREGIVAAVHRQLSQIRRDEVAAGAAQPMTVMVGRWWDALPPGVDTEAAQTILRMIKAHGHRLIVCTKQPDVAALDMLDAGDTLCVSIGGSAGAQEPGALPLADRLCRLFDVQEATGCTTAARVLILDRAYSLRLAGLPVDRIVWEKPRRLATVGFITEDMFLANSGGRGAFA